MHELGSRQFRLSVCACRGPRYEAAARQAPQDLRQKEAEVQRTESDLKRIRNGEVVVNPSSGIPLDGLKLQEDLRSLKDKLDHLRVRAARSCALARMPPCPAPAPACEPRLYGCRGARGAVDSEAVEQRGKSGV